MLKFLVLILFISSASVFSQDTNCVVIDEVSEKPMLLGYTTREALTDSNFGWWFNSGYENYEPDTSLTFQIRDNLDDIKIIIVMGTWCSDSRVHVPHMFKILDQAGYSSDPAIINVDREKETKGDELENLDINFVPTFIIYRNGIEIGRIVENPAETLEADLLSILGSRS